MIRLARHIEILLLGNECVIVPNLGGFVAHRVSARYDECGTFLPPSRTLGFNPQLTMNDSLLAQSYSEAYDMSYFEAVDAIEDDVRAVLRSLGNSGSCELQGLGRLYYDHDGRMNFEPCDEGLLTPEFYALGAFDMLPQPQISTLSAADGGAGEEAAVRRPRVIYIGSDDGQKTLNISLKAIRGVAVAAAVIATVFLIAFPLSKSGSTFPPRSIESGFYEMFMPHAASSATIKGKTNSTTPAKNPSEPAAKPAKPAATPTESTTNSTESTAVNNSKASGSSAPLLSDGSGEVWSIVLCSHVTKKNAEQLAATLKAKGYDGITVSTRGAVKVLYGRFASKADALARLNALSGDDTFRDAWILESKE